MVETVTSPPLLLPPSPVADVVLECELSRSPTAVVYRGRMHGRDAPVALKVMRGTSPATWRFYRDRELLRGLHHPNIVSCLRAAVTAAGQPYLLLDLVEGPTLAGWLRDRGPIDTASALRLIRTISLALDHANQRGLNHHALRPEHILLASDPAALPAAPFPLIPRLIGLGVGAGNHDPENLAPEQHDDPEHADHRADIYALGCLLHHALTGTPAFPYQDERRSVSAKITGSYSRALTDPGIRALVADLLRPQRELRLLTFAEVIERCDILLERAQRPHNHAAWIGFGMCMGILGLTCGLWWWKQRPILAPGEPVPVSASSPTLR